MNRIIARLNRLQSGDSLYSFLEASWPIIEPQHPFLGGWHIEAICEHLEAVYEGQILNLLINIPPRHAKSTIVSVGYPAWVWHREPAHKFIFASHGDSLAKRDAMKHRQIVESQWYREVFKVDWELREDQNEKKYFLNTRGGMRLSTTMRGALIGHGGDTLVLDDPHSPASVRSEVQRKTELEWIDESFFTRVNDPHTVKKIAIMQRLDERDASAHLLKKGNWEHLMLPAMFEGQRRCTTKIGWTDPRTAEGQPLWEQRFDAAGLQAMAAGMGSKAWAGQGQQRPAPAEGNIINRLWFKTYKVLPDDIDFLALSVDLPFEEGPTNSFAVFQVWARRKAERYLVKQYRRQIGFTEQLAVFKSLAVHREGQHGIGAKWVEKKANGAALIATVCKEISGVLPVTPLGSKQTRLEAVSPQFEAGNVFVPDPTVEGNAWVNDYIEELVTFPNALYDDQVDATSQALLKLGNAARYDIAPVSISGGTVFPR